jgi:hypothetical protein
MRLSLFRFVLLCVVQAAKGKLAWAKSPVAKGSKDTLVLKDASGNVLTKLVM